MKKLLLISPIPPSVNNYLHYKVESKITPKGKIFFVKSYPSDETKVYKIKFRNYVENQIKIQNWTKPEKGKLVFVKCAFYLDRKRKDPNNFLKVPLDVFSEAGVYCDDDIALPLAPRLYIDAENPRIEFEIYESDFIGIFEDKTDYENFVSENCTNCKRWRNGKCGVLKAALDNRITGDVLDRKCQKRR